MRKEGRYLQNDGQSPSQIKVLHSFPEVCFQKVMGLKKKGPDVLSSPLVVSCMRMHTCVHMLHNACTLKRKGNMEKLGVSPLSFPTSFLNL